MTENKKSPKTVLGPRFTKATALALELHCHQARKGPDRVPYFSHLLAVAALVLESGGDEDEAIAALLHDGPEDQGGRETLERIRQEFGKDVANIVEGCSDTLEREKGAWRPRKERYIAHLREASPSVRRVAAADKLHNLSGLLHEMRTLGAGVFERFTTGSPRDQVWYYTECARALVEDGGPPLARRVEEAAAELAEAVERIEASA